jgi:hypothetical protein
MKNLSEVKINETNMFLVTSVKYEIGGYSYATYRHNPRGYYLTVIPNEIKGDWYMMAAFSGYRELIIEVSRQGDKKYLEAIKQIIDKPQTLFEMLVHTCKNNNYKVDVDEIYIKTLENIRNKYILLGGKI